jgi:hypothetical protein
MGLIKWFTFARRFRTREGVGGVGGLAGMGKLRHCYKTTSGDDCHNKYGRYVTGRGHKTTYFLFSGNLIPCTSSSVPSWC